MKMAVHLEQGTCKNKNIYLVSKSIDNPNKHDHG